MAVAQKGVNWYIIESRKVIIDGKTTYKPKWIPIEAKTENEAREAEREYKEHKNQGLVFDPNLTVYKLSELWMEKHVKSPMKPLASSTAEFYQDKLDTWIIPKIGAILIRKLTVDDLDEVLADCAKTGALDTTLRGVYATMSAMFGWGKRKRKIKNNLMELVDRPEVAERETPTIAPEDFSKLLQTVLMPGKYDTKYAQNQRRMYHTMFLVELTTALRIDELCGIREMDIDFERKILHVRQQVTKAGSEPEFGPAKDRKNKLADAIPLADSVVEALREELEAKKSKRKEAESVGREWREYGLVFCNETGGPIDSKNLNTRTLKAALKKAGLREDVSFHDLRHSVLTALAEMDEDPNAMADLARHKDVGFMMKTYVHKRNNKRVESQRVASKKLEALVAPKVKEKSQGK
jgi:integrase